MDYELEITIEKHARRASRLMPLLLNLSEEDIEQFRNERQEKIEDLRAVLQSLGPAIYGKGRIVRNWATVWQAAKMVR